MLTREGGSHHARPRCLVEPSSPICNRTPPSQLQLLTASFVNSVYAARHKAWIETRHKQHKCRIEQFTNGAQHKRHKIVDWFRVYSNVQRKIEQGAQNTAAQNRAQHKIEYMAHMCSCPTEQRARAIKKGIESSAQAQPKVLMVQKPCILPQRCNIKSLVCI